MIGEFLEEILKLGFIRERRLLTTLFSICFPIFVKCTNSRAGAAAGRTSSRVEPSPWTSPGISLRNARQHVATTVAEDTDCLPDTLPLVSCLLSAPPQVDNSDHCHPQTALPFLLPNSVASGPALFFQKASGCCSYLEANYEPEPSCGRHRTRPVVKHYILLIK